KMQSVLQQCLQLWVSLLMISPLQGRVVTHPHVQVLVDLPLTLACNLTLARGETLKQVRWMDGRNVTFLTYLSRQRPSITDPERVVLATATQDSSAITIRRVGPIDEGCYRCLFDVFPSGTQEGQTCLTVIATVSSHGNRTAVSGKGATLSCRYGLPKRVHQVLWMKKEVQGEPSNVASFAKRGEPTVLNSLQGRVSISRTLDESHLSIKPVRMEDEGCYVCEFHAYPEGIKSTVACLTIYVLPRPQVNHKAVSDGVIEANCTALARPAAEVVWNVEGDNRTLGPPAVSSFQQSDGTTLVVSTLSLRTEILRHQSVKCLVHHLGLESAISVSMNTKIGKALTILIAVTSVAAVILMCLCFCLWKCFLQKDD
ncbi:OX-2 membrane glycoprotein-like, partial [Arapaima gigas]